MRCTLPTQTINTGKPYEKVVWICATFNMLSKAECDSQQIRESVLETLTADVGGLSIGDYCTGGKPADILHEERFRN
jgi:hypothetical protein